MYHFPSLLFVCSLVIPFGVYEPSDASSDVIKPQHLQSCAVEADTSDDANGEEPELYLANPSVVDCFAQFKGCLVVVRGTVPPTKKSDSLGCRPPPVVQIG